MPRPDAQSGPIHFDCPHCLAKLHVATGLAGGTINCPKCGKPIRVPATSTDPPEPLPGAYASPRPPVARDDSTDRGMLYDVAEAIYHVFLAVIVGAVVIGTAWLLELFVNASVDSSIAHNPPYGRFASDNAIGAAANALDRIEFYLRWILILLIANGLGLGVFTVQIRRVMKRASAK